jgi:hypothetical protein
MNGFVGGKSIPGIFCDLFFSPIGVFGVGRDDLAEDEQATGPETTGRS